MSPGKSAIALGLILVLAIGGILSYWLFMNQDKGTLDNGNNLEPDDESQLPGTPSFDYKGLLEFSEIHYKGQIGEEFVEIRVSKNKTVFLGEITLVIGNYQVLLPNATNVPGYTYIPIYFTSGSSDLDGSDGTVKLFLGISTSKVLDDKGEALIKDPEGKVIDYVRWGGFSTSLVSEYWDAGDTGATANGTESLQLFGPDTDSSANWLSAEPTPGTRSALRFSTGLGINVLLENGASIYPFYLQDALPGLRSNVSFELRNNTHSPVNATVASLVREMVNFTLNFYHELGFPNPVTSSNNTIIITLVNRTAIDPFTNATTGSGNPRGTIVLYIPKYFNRVDAKVAIEHEIMHLVQFNKTRNSDNETISNAPMPYSRNQWWLDGMAEYWGVRSAMRNFNITMGEVKNNTRKVGSPNWHDYRDTNMSTFWEWGGTWADYEMGFQFIKFLMEKYGFDIIKKIHERTQRNFSNASKTVSAQQALERTLNKTMDAVLLEFYEWRVFNRQNGEMPEVILHQNVTIGSSPTPINLKDFALNESVARGGALVQRINFNGTKMVAVGVSSEKNANLSIIIRYHFKNGTEKTKRISNNNAPGAFPIVVNPNETAYIILVKIRHLNATSSNFRLWGTELPGLSLFNPFRLFVGTIYSVLLPTPNENGTFWFALTLQSSQSLNLTLTRQETTGPYFFFNVYDEKQLLFSSTDVFDPSNSVSYWTNYFEVPANSELTIYIEIVPTTLDGWGIVTFEAIQV